jgi:hypothetical protein
MMSFSTVQYLVFLAVPCLVTCAANTDGASAYKLEVQIVGPREVWQDVTAVEVAGKSAPLPPGRAGQFDDGTTVFLCTKERDRFLSMTAIPIRVHKKDMTTVESSVERVACRFAKTPGFMEGMQIRLLADGHIEADFETPGSNEWTYCSSDRKSTCPANDL